MLTEAQIELVDDAGNVEDRVRIVGTGEVALATRGTSRLEVTPEDLTEIDAVIRVRDGVVTIEAKKHQVLWVDDVSLPMATPRDIQRALIAFVSAVRRYLHVRTVVNPSASLMSPGGAVIRDQPTEFERWLAASAARGAAKVSEQLAHLRARGIIDDQGKLLVPFPKDMNPESKTDV